MQEHIYKECVQQERSDDDEDEGAPGAHSFLLLPVSGISRPAQQPHLVQEHAEREAEHKREE
jgi:hypothetical protein